MKPGDQQSEVSAIIGWKRRADLIMRPHEAGGWVVKDPLSLRYMLLSDVEMCVLRMLDGRCTTADICQRLAAAWPAQQFDVRDVVDFLKQLIAGGLVLLTPRNALPATGSPATGSPVAEYPVAAYPVAEYPVAASPAAGFAARQLPAGQPPAGRLLRRIPEIATRLFRIQIPLFDPTRLLRRFRSLIDAVFSPGAVIAGLALMLMAVLLVALNADRLTRHLRDSMSLHDPRNLLLMLLCFVVVKAVHEMGHACAAFRYNVECREAGIMLLFFTPLLYTNVTDSWMVGRRERLVITASGILAELLIASVCTILWYFSAPGLLRSLLLNTMILCSVSTLLFNGNPLLRYDGYFLLADALDRPNLASRATSRCRAVIEDLLLGPEDRVTRFKEPFLLTYGLLSGIYRLALATGILAVLLNFSRACNVPVAGFVLAAAAGGLMLVLPLMTSATSLFVGILSRRNPGRSAIRCALILAAVCGGLLIPIPDSLHVAAVVESAGVPVFTTIGGHLRQFADYGEYLERGDMVAELEDPQLNYEALKLRGDEEQQRMLVRSMELQRRPADVSELPRAKEMLNAAVARREQFESQRNRLRIAAVADGLLLPPRATPPSEADDELLLPEGCGSPPLKARNSNAFLEAGTLLGYIAPPTRFDLVLYLQETETSRVRPGQTVVFQPHGRPSVSFTGEVQQISAVAVDQIPAELAQMRTLSAVALQQLQQDGAWWQASVALECHDATERPELYSVGMTRIALPAASIAERIRRYLRAVFQDEPSI